MCRIQSTPPVSGCSQPVVPGGARWVTSLSLSRARAAPLTFRRPAARLPVPTWALEDDHLSGPCLRSARNSPLQRAEVSRLGDRTTECVSRLLHKRGRSGRDCYLCGGVLTGTYNFGLPTLGTYCTTINLTHLIVL